MAVPVPGAELNPQPGRSVVWVGLAITVLGLSSNWLYFVNLPAQGILPWINLLVPAIGLLILCFGAWRAFAKPRTYGGKLVGSAFAVLCAPLVAMSTWGFFHARDIPRPSGAPRVGQRAPDFTLASASGESLSLSQLLSQPMENSAPPKAVLLIFYRGYW